MALPSGGKLGKQVHKDDKFGAIRSLDCAPKKLAYPAVENIHEGSGEAGGGETPWDAFS